MRWPVPAPLVSSRSSPDWVGSCQGSLVRWQYLWQGVFEEKENVGHFSPPLKIALPSSHSWKRERTMLSPPLTFAATACCRAKCWLPESSSSGWVRSTWECEALRTLATATMISSIVAIQGSRRCNAEVAWWGRQRRTFWLKKSKDENKCF